MGDITCGVHWYTFTASQACEDVLDALGGSCSEVEYRGGYGHPQRVIHESGAEVYFGSRREDQPVCVNAPGEVCEGAADDLVKVSRQLEGRPTRIDLAVDLEPPELARRRIREMHRAWMRGKVRTNLAPGSHQMHKDEGEGQGVTAVFGRRKSGFLMRAYDRRGPLRIEQEWHPHKDIREVVPELLMEKGPGSVWRRLAQEVVFPMEWYQELLVGPAVEWERGEDEETKLGAYIESLRAQHGVGLWMLLELGVKLGDLATEPERPMGRMLQKGARWAREAEALGLDGTELKRVIDLKAKGRRVKL